MIQTLSWARQVSEINEARIIQNNRDPEGHTKLKSVHPIKRQNKKTN